MDFFDNMQIINIKKDIEKSKKLLESTDYKIIKIIEYDSALLSPPYDIKALHEERQALRDRINKL